MIIIPGGYNDVSTIDEWRKWERMGYAGRNEKRTHRNDGKWHDVVRGPRVATHLALSISIGAEANETKKAEYTTFSGTTPRKD